MIRNKNKIIRSVTVSISLGFCREVMIKMRVMGYTQIGCILIIALFVSCLLTR